MTEIPLEELQEQNSNTVTRLRNLLTEIFQANANFFSFIEQHTTAGARMFCHKNVFPV